MCTYYTLDFHGCGCRLRCPSKPPIKCELLAKRRSKWKRRIFAQLHRRSCMVITWETSKLKCPHCRVLEHFSAKLYDRARNERLWVGHNGTASLKLLERNSERGETSLARVWGKATRNCLDILYHVETSVSGAAAATTTVTPTKTARKVSGAGTKTDVKTSMDVIVEEVGKLRV